MCLHDHATDAARSALRGTQGGSVAPKDLNWQQHGGVQLLAAGVRQLQGSASGRCCQACRSTAMLRAVCSVASLQDSGLTFCPMCGPLVDVRQQQHRLCPQGPRCPQDRCCVFSLLQLVWVHTKTRQCRAECGSIIEGVQQPGSCGSGRSGWSLMLLLTDQAAGTQLSCWVCNLQCGCWVMLIMYRWGQVLSQPPCGCKSVARASLFCTETRSAETHAMRGAPVCSQGSQQQGIARLQLAMEQAHVQ
jgi:hypothetical protein